MELLVVADCWEYKMTMKSRKEQNHFIYERSLKRRTSSVREE